MSPQHADQRNRRRVYVANSPIAIKTANGQAMTIPGGGQEYSVVERWCGWCQSWVECKGIIFAMICPECHHDWHEVPPAAIDDAGGR